MRRACTLLFQAQTSRKAPSIMSDFLRPRALFALYFNSLEECITVVPALFYLDRVNFGD